MQPGKQEDRFYVQKERSSELQSMSSKSVETPTVNIAVRDLVNFSLRSGDLFRRSFGGSTAMEGILGHQRVQRSRPDHYRAEVAVKHNIDCGDFHLEIGGRIDGVFEKDPPVVIEEIKTTRLPFEEIPEQAQTLHAAQAKFYAYLYLLNYGGHEAVIQLTTFNLDNYRSQITRETCGLAPLRQFSEALMEGYLHWARKQFSWRKTRDQSLDGLAFPYGDFRPYQRKLAVDTYRTIGSGGLLFAQAPTGIGKTAATLFPALKALGEGATDKLFFLTAKTAGARVAEKTLDHMRDGGMKLKSLVLSAKDKMCIKPSCNPDYCDLAKGYYDRLKDALPQLYGRDSFDRQSLLDTAERHQLCPFEWSLELANWADLVICDYNYAFDPSVSLRRFFGSASSSSTVLVDEAHNLVDRARDMFSAALFKTRVLQCRRLVRKDQPLLGRNLAAINRQFLNLRKNLEQGSDLVPSEGAPPKQLAGPLSRFCGTVQEVMSQPLETELPRPVLELYFDIRRYLRCADMFDTAFHTLFRVNDKEVEIKIANLDPSSFLRDRFRQLKAAVLFSATLTPFDYFVNLLGGDKDSITLRLPSPFGSENLKVVAAPFLSTLYRKRKAGLPALADLILSVTASKQGHYFVYFPSYRYLNDLAAELNSRDHQLDLAIQEPGMNDAQRDAFLGRFEESGTRSLVGLAVMGGAFGEGIDLVGKRLIGVVVVGVGLPALCQERGLIKDYFQSLNGNGCTNTPTSSRA